MAFYLNLAEIHNLLTTDKKLTDLGYSESQRLMIRWSMKTLMLTYYLIFRFYARPYVNQLRLLKVSAMVMALTISWIPCLTAFPTLSVLLIFIETFFFIIGPFVTMPLQANMLSNRNRQSMDALQVVFGNFLVAWIFQTIYGYRMAHNLPPLMSNAQLCCFCALFVVVLLEVRETLEKNRRLDERLEQEMGIGYV